MNCNELYNRVRQACVPPVTLEADVDEASGPKAVSLWKPVAIYLGQLEYTVLQDDRKFHEYTHRNREGQLIFAGVPIYQVFTKTHCYIAAYPDV